ncbi:DNA repair protein RAD51 homolog 2-like isoform X2 [Uloborus diversus]|uniref:DNA repair protein RAD51 homolog 2-like isoform X2 n=1 Tax=Uloborus diversus TaxID=327109 RepID=UPI00240A6DE5|nr:DNA repair protein RAD51 homolog 2-like isoform X2 [Uloborus diversus]
MGSLRIRRLPLAQNIIEALEKQNFKYCKVFNLYSSQKKTNSGFFSSSLHALDNLLLGGIPIGNVTELSGPPGVGKTQFCFMFCILAAMPTTHDGLNGNIIYIDTEAAFCSKRICQIALNRFPHLYNDEGSVIALLEKIKVYRAMSSDVLTEIIPHVEKEVIQNKVKLIIVDSIASLLRKEYGSAGSESFQERNQILVKQAAILKDIAQTYGIVVFLTNQITTHSSEWDRFTRDDDLVDAYSGTNLNGAGKGSLAPASLSKKVKVCQGADYDHVIPALGTTWAHCVNTRLVAQFLDADKRQLTVSKSPVAPNASVCYMLNESGVVLTDDDIEFVNAADKAQQNICTRNNFLTSEITGI